MKEALSIIGPVVASIGFVPYLRETMSGKVKPRIASWASWSLVTGIATFAELSHHSYTSAFLTGVATLIEVSILIMALRQGDYDYNWVDAVSQTISLIGLISWLLASAPALAIIFNIIADLFGCIPTLYHSWIAPHDEAWLPFVLSGVGAALSFLAVSKIGFVSAGFPIYLALIGLLLGANIYIRQKMVTKPELNNNEFSGRST